MQTLSISNLSKTYPNGIQALNDISREIKTGIFGLLGPNGAGKSSLMRTIATLQDADKGTLKLGNLNILEQKNQFRKLLGYLPQEFGVYPRLSASLFLDHLAVLKGISNKKVRNERVNEVLNQVNLYSVRKQKLGSFSGGMKRRFGIAQALLTNPKVLIVDEPTAGLDPAERNTLHNLLSFVGQSAIVILSTHLVTDVKHLCNRMAIMDKGTILLHCEPQQALKEIQGKVWQKQVQFSDLDLYRSTMQVISEELVAGKPQVRVLDNKCPANGFIPAEVKLEDVYFRTLQRS